MKYTVTYGTFAGSYTVTYDANAVLFGSFATVEK